MVLSDLEKLFPRRASQAMGFGGNTAWKNETCCIVQESDGVISTSGFPPFRQQNGDKYLQMKEKIGVNVLFMNKGAG